MRFLTSFEMTRLKNMPKLSYIPLSEIRRIRENITDPIESCKILSDIFRINTLYMIAKAGSGHVGTSFSCLDIITWLWTQEMKYPNESSQKEHDYFFSSKGHDVPALYSLLIGLEKLEFEYIHKLRRLNGLPGHPDISTPYIVTNTGSLGMGISKARGMAIANRLKRNYERNYEHIYVLTGDGELQEGQIWESLQPTANGKFSEIMVIVDHNKLQSDTWVDDVSKLGNLEDKFRSFGWEVARCNGHDFKAIQKILKNFKSIKNKPKILIADTIKGKGVSFMKSSSLNKEDLYKYHSGSPSADEYNSGLDELVEKINKTLKEKDIQMLQLEFAESPSKPKFSAEEKLINAYSDELSALASKNESIVVLDGDLMLDCGLVPFKKKFPKRFVECGIAEQDMVSTAGGLALGGYIPVVHSFSCFLSTRPNEQIYNNATEKTKIIYTGSLAGILPAGPGHSHQSVRDISTIGSIPGIKMIEPCNEVETRLALRWAVDTNKENTFIRLTSIPVHISYKLPNNYELQLGKGVQLVKGNDMAIITYGPIMLNEAMKAAKFLKKNNVSASVYNLPWLNIIDAKWLLKEFLPYKIICTLDNHYLNMGQGHMISSELAKIKNAPTVISFGVRDIPACGQNDEVLKHHGLDSESIVKKIEKTLK